MKQEYPLEQTRYILADPKVYFCVIFQSIPPFINLVHNMAGPQTKWKSEQRGTEANNFLGRLSAENSASGPRMGSDRFYTRSQLRRIKKDAGGNVKWTAR